MTYQLFNLPRATAISNNLTLVSGAKVSFFLTTTSTPTDTYQDSARTTPHTNPVVADAAGRFPAIYLDPEVVYRITFTDADDVEIYPAIDPANDQLLTQALFNAYLALSDPYKRTAAEIAAGVTPVNYAYEPLNVLRYGNNTTPGTTDMATAIQNAINVAAVDVATHSVGGAVYFPKNVYQVTSSIVVPEGVSLVGDGYLASAIRTASAIVLLDITPAATTEMGVTIRDISIQGDDATTDDLVQVGTTGQVISRVFFERARLRGTSGSCVRWTGECLEVSLRDTIIESFAQYGLEVTALASLLNLDGVTCNANDTNGVALLGILAGGGAGQVSLKQVNVNGNNTLDNVIRVVGGNLSQCAMRECYAEFMAGSIVAATSTGVLSQFVCEGGNFSSNDSSDFDLTGGAAHGKITLSRISSARTSGQLMSAGSTTEYLVRDCSTSGGTAVTVSGVAGVGASSNVSKATDGSAHVNVTGTFSGTLTGCDTSPTGTLRYISEGGQVVLFIPSITGTSNSTACTITGMPAAIRPARTQALPCRYTDNGTNALGLVSIATDGTISLLDSTGSSSFFTASGTKGSALCVVPYSLE